MKRIAILASGTGSNARKIIEHLQENQYIEVGLVASNRKSAKVLNMASDYDIDTRVITRADFYESDTNRWDVIQLSESTLRPGQSGNHQWQESWQKH